MKYKCIDCGKELCSGNHRCKECNLIYQRSGGFGFQKGHKTWNKGMRGTIPWNKGLTAQTDDRVKKNAMATSKTLKGVKRGSVFVTPELHEKLSEPKRGDKNPAKRLIVREKIRRTTLKNYKEHPEILENRKRSGRNQYSYYFTDIERKIVDVLNNCGIEYRHNAPIGRYFADFVIFDKVIIECDGSYWHQSEVADSKKNEFYHDNGYFVFRLGGDRIHESPEECVRLVIDIMNTFDVRDVSNIMKIRFSGCQVETLPWKVSE